MQKSIQAATQTTITVIRLERKKEKEKILSFIFKCAKSECLNLKRQDLWTPSLVSVWSFVHLQQTKLECAVGVNVALWRSDRRKGAVGRTRMFTFISHRDGWNYFHYRTKNIRREANLSL
jgi:hypothetical protein